jgi:hypothetical protein
MSSDNPKFYALPAAQAFRRAAYAMLAYEAFWCAGSITVTRYVYKTSVDPMVLLIMAMPVVASALMLRRAVATEIPNIRHANQEIARLRAATGQPANKATPNPS